MSDTAPVARRLPLKTSAVVLLIFAAALAGITWRVRSTLREQVLQRESEAIYSVALLQLTSPAANGLPELGATDPDADLFDAVLISSGLRRVLAVRLYDATGAQRRALPDLAQPEPLEPAILGRMRAGEKSWQFFPKMDPEVALGLPPRSLNATPAPLLEVTVPLQRPKSDELLGAARYWMDGADVLGEFQKIDRQLAFIAGIAFFCGALLLTGVLTWAFEQLNRTNRALSLRTEDLVRANRELAFVAKTSALGAISAHLIHDLKNPLAGLEGFVRDEAASTEKAGGGDAWKEAVQTAERLRNTVTDIAALLRDEADGAFVPLSPAEIAKAAMHRSAEASARTGVKVVPETRDPGAAIPGREANLAVLVLANLLDNACKASPSGADVRLTARAGNQGLEFLVTDCGPGLPDAVRKELFQPKTSSRPGGGGLGLAISQQLARHAGGKIELVRSGPEGTQFRFLLPL